MATMTIRKQRMKKIKYCVKCKLHHSGKVCPKLTGHLEVKWQLWYKQYAEQIWHKGTKANGYTWSQWA